MQFTPAYRATIYAPRSEDPTEATVMTPVAGSAHADPFQVATVYGVPGFQPYMQMPGGRKSALDHLTRKLTIPSITFDILDALTDSGVNAQRWATAFLGGPRGELRPIGSKVVIEECLHFDADNPTVGWLPYSTGRVRQPKLTGRLWITVEAKGMAAELERKIFTTLPDASVAYAFAPSLFPPGLSQSFGPFGAGRDSAFAVDSGAPMPVSLPGITTARATVPSNGVTVQQGTVILDAGDPRFRIVTDAAKSMFADGLVRRVYLTDVATGVTGAFRWKPNTAADIESQTVAGADRRVLARLTGVEVLTDDPEAMAFPADGSSVLVRVTREHPPTKDVPLLIDNVHPVQLLADICDGKFSVPSVDRTALIPLMERDTSPGGPWATLLADQSIPTGRFVVAAASKANDWIEKNICQPFQLAYREDAQGRMVPQDLRRASLPAVVGTLTDADLVANAAPEWAPTRDGAVTGIDLTYYVDTQIPFATILQSSDLYPKVALSMVASEPADLYIANDLSTLRDLGDKTVKIDASGIRFQFGDVFVLWDPVRGNYCVRDDVLARITGLLQDELAPYSTGVVKSVLPCQRTDLVEAIEQGDVVAVEVSTLPDPATRERGGSRLVLVLSKSEDRVQTRLEVLDLGADVNAAAPGILLAAVAGDASAIDVTVTLNGAEDMAVIETAVTDTTVVAPPPSTSGLWVRRDPVTASGVTRIARLSRGRVWARARSQSSGWRLMRPSGWAYAGGAGHVDLTALVAPTSLGLESSNGDYATASWAVGEAALPLQLLLVLGGVPAVWLPSHVAGGLLLPGSILGRVDGITPGETYSVGVRHLDPDTGAVSDAASVTFTAADAGALLPPSDPTAFAGTQIGSGTLRADGSYGLAVAASVIPGAVEFREAVETDIDSDAYGAWRSIGEASSVSGGWTQIARVAPNDGKRRRLAARSVRGASVSDWTDPADVLPWTPIELPVYSAVVAELTGVQYTPGDAFATVQFTPNAATAEVWAAYAVVATPAPLDFAPLALASLPLPAGATTYLVPMPPDGSVTLVQLEARHANLKAGSVSQLTVTAAPQVPHVEPDDVETATTGTQFIRITERGLAVVQVQTRTQVGTSPISEWGAPTRGPGDASAVRPTVNAGVLQAGEWEHDTPLDATRSSYIEFELLLANGALLLAGPFQFDWDKRPNLYQVGVAGTVVTVQGDSDTKAIGLYSKTRAWKYEQDGVFGQIDVAAAGTDGSAGLGAGASDTFTATAWSDPVAYLDGSTLSAVRDVVVGNAAPPPAASWLQAFAQAPPTNGSRVVTVNLQASAAPAGWTVALIVSDDEAPEADMTADLTPALSAPPVVLAAYDFSATYARQATGAGVRDVTVAIRVELRDGTGVVQGTRTMAVTYRAVAF